MNIAEKLPQIEEIALSAGKIARSFFMAPELKKRLKSRFDVVSEADETVEKFLIRELKKVDDIAFLSEEFNPRTGLGSPCWIIDPIDGTTNFVAGIAPFAVSIAHFNGSEVDAGVCLLPMSGELFSAARGEGAKLNGETIRVSSETEPEKCVIATGFADITQGGEGCTLPVFLSLIHKTRAIRRLGSAVTDLVYTACGKFAFFYEAGLSPWDVAAGSLIVSEAGGKVTDFNGGNDFLTGKTIIASSPQLYDFIKNEINA